MGFYEQIDEAITKVLEDLVKNQPEFSHIESEKVFEIIDDLGEYENSEAMRRLEMELFSFVLREELVAFAKRNSGIITHLDCFDILVRILFKENNRQPYDVNITNDFPIRVKL